jgi:hypothetical protein
VAEGGREGDNDNDCDCVECYDFDSIGWQRVGDRVIMIVIKIWLALGG